MCYDNRRRVYGVYYKENNCSAQKMLILFELAISIFANVLFKSYFRNVSESFSKTVRYR